MANLSKAEQLKTFLRQSVQCIFNRVNEQFDESKSKVSYLITHLDRVIYILSRAFSFFFFLFPPSR